MINVAIIDDDPLILASVQGILEMETGFQCILTSQTIEGFFRQAPKLEKVDILLLDIDLDGTNSLEILPAILERYPRLPIILLTGFANSEYMMDGIKKGVSGYFLKGSPPEKLVEALRATAAGGAYLEPRLAGAVVSAFRESYPKEIFTPDFSQLETLYKAELSRRERDILEGLVNEMSYKEIASRYNISINTVRHYVKGIYRKFGVATKRELIRLVHLR
ncbi:MAG: response regulator transcription factor [Lewinellaceae bacterium]|nr:response regulator transcription factor [Lewinellaceae bacterium]